MNWILENLGTVVISAVLLAVVVAIIAGQIRKRKKGENSCGCGCDHCASAAVCHPSMPTKQKSPINKKSVS